jgi:glutamine synthetase
VRSQPFAAEVPAGDQAGPGTLAPWLIDWGLDNRSAIVRISPERGAAARLEIRLGDATANPYLAMAAIGARRFTWA